jgi:hypothetical protein
MGARILKVVHDMQPPSGSSSCSAPASVSVSGIDFKDLYFAVNSQTILPQFGPVYSVSGNEQITRTTAKGNESQRVMLMEARYFADGCK